MTDIYAFVKPGEPCLDFVNSKVWITRSQPFVDLFSDYEPVAYWFRHLDLITEAEVEQTLKWAAQHPAEAQVAFEKILTLRDANYRTLTALVHLRQPAGADLDLLHQTLIEAETHRQLTVSPNGIRWVWKGKEDNLVWTLWPLAQTTAELLTSDRLHRLRECGGCYWLFMDTSRNGMRRWCDMKTCGNRAKAHRHYEKSKILKA